MTGTNRERPGLREALAACRAGDTLVVTKLDRLARSVPDARDIIYELRFVVIELKIGRFEPGHLGQLGFYVLGRSEPAPARPPRRTFGILLCAGRTDNVVRYALASASATAPLAVADYTYDTLPPRSRKQPPPASS